MLWYSSKFKSLIKWCYYTAITEFVVFLFYFLCVSYLSTSLSIRYDSDSSANFTSQYEKYFVLASSLYMIIPFAFSTIFLFGLFHKNAIILKVFIVGSVTNACVIFITVISSGIFIVIKGVAYVGYCLIGFGFILIAILVHGALIVEGIRVKYEGNTEGTATSEIMQETLE